MTALFWNFFEVTVSASIVIGLILLLRLFSRRVPKTIVCVLWAIVFVRLLLPIQIESPVSVQPHTASAVRQETQRIAQEHFVGNLSVVPQTNAATLQTSAVDFGVLISAAWVVGVAAMLLYMLISYFRLRQSLRNAIVKENNIFIVPGLKTAFLFGYFRPGIYLPPGMGEEETALVIAHERAHLKRGDGWLKLLGFVTLAFHWYNPLVWLAYALLCKDIESACDEYVVRDMQETDRKAYASALLSCDSRCSGLLGNPVAFAEDNVKKRIVRVLDYRKPALWISIAAVVVVLLVSVFVLPDAMGTRHPEYYDELISMLGQPIDKVCEELGISRDDLIKVESESYKTPFKAEYAGVSFDLWLYPLHGTDTFAAFQYYNVYEGNREQAVKDTVAVANRLFAEFGEGDQTRSSEDLDRLKTATVESVSKLFENEKYRSVGYSTLGDQWDITNSGDGNIEEYLTELEKSELWQEVYAPQDLLPTYAIQFIAWNDHIEDVAYLGILYDIEFEYDADEDNIFYATKADPPTWWDKFLSWLK